MKKTKTRKNDEIRHRSMLVKYGDPWPDWRIYLVGVAGGFQTFECNEDGEAWLAKYREKHKNNKPSEYINDVEEPTMRKIGF